MNIIIRATNLELTPELRAYIEEKFSNLTRYFENILEVHIEIEKTTRHHQKGRIFRAEANLRVPIKGLLRVEKAEKDIYKAIDKVKDHFKEELVRYKEKLREHCS
jgi:putative sigma-54 modulation protein